MTGSTKRSGLSGIRMVKRVLTVSLLLFGLVALCACSPAEEPTTPPGDSGQPVTPVPDPDEDTTMTNLTILLTVGGHSFTATLVENTATVALTTRLAKGPLTVSLDDYGNMEKVGSLGFTLPRSDVSTTTSPGDIILYQGSSLVIFYGSNTWSYTRLGRVDGVSSREEMLELLGGKGSVEVTLSLIEADTQSISSTRIH